MTLCILLINKKSLKPSILNGFQAFYSQKVSKTESYHKTIVMNQVLGEKKIPKKVCSTVKRVRNICI
jgi:hypothetical protein